MREKELKEPTDIEPPGQKIFSISGQGIVQIGRNTIQVTETDISVNGKFLKNEHHAAVDREGNVVLGGFIRDFE
jgi:hypothetical protein